MAKKKSDSEKKSKGKKSVKVSKKSPEATPAILPTDLPVFVRKPKSPAKPKAPAKKKSAARPAITGDDIALRAYFIAERRQKMGWPGDSTGDWVEAERQLVAEAKKAR